LTYRFLLFDIDDTLLDFKAGEMKSLGEMFTELHIPTSPVLEETYLRINQSLWQQYEKGEISREDIFHRRFVKTFKHMDIDADGLLAERVYHQKLDQQAVVIPRVTETLAALQDYELYIVSNGVEAAQLSRLRKSGLFQYFRDIFVSDTVGTPKPTKAFFTYVAQHIPHFDRHQAMIIGDSLTSDIQGGINAKIDTVWYNPHFTPNRSHIKPTYQLAEINNLTALLLANQD
jgi:YjjG family noncanonical pyrimidine nucleotidase